MSHALRYGIVSRRIWRDEWFRTLTGPARELWFYLLTSPHAAGIPGVLVVWKDAIAFDLRWRVAELDGAWSALEPDGEDPKVFADWSTGLVWLPRAVRHDPPAGPNHVRAFARRWGELPDCDLRETARIGVASELNRINPAFGQLFLDGSPTGSRVRARVRHTRADPDPNPDPNPNPGVRAGAHAHTRAREGSAPPPAPAPPAPPENPPTQLRLVPAWPDEEHRSFAREHGLELDDQLDDYRWHCRDKSKGEEPTGEGFMRWLRRARTFLKRDTQRNAKPPGAVEHERRTAARAVRPRKASTPPARLDDRELEQLAREAMAKVK